MICHFLLVLPSYAPAVLWQNELSRACAGSWGRCSVWSSQESDRHRASVNVSKGKGVHIPLHLYSQHTELRDSCVCGTQR